MLNLIPKKYIIILGLAVALGVVLYFWRSEIYRAAQNALQAQINQKTIEVSEKRNEIANNRPSDDAVFFNGLLSDDQW